MIGKLSKGTELNGLLEYLLGELDQKKERREMVKIIGGTCDGRDAKSIYKEMMYIRALRPNLGTYTFNESLRLPPGEKLDDQTFAEVGDQWAQQMGFTTYTIIKHSDSEIHVAGIRITASGDVVSDSQDYKRSEKIIRQLELEYGLSIVAESHLLNENAVSDAPKQPTLGQRKYFEKTGNVPPKLFIADAIAKVLKDSNGNITASDFISEMQKYGIEPIANVQSTGTMSGFSFQYDGKTMKGSDVDRKYSWGNLKKQGVSYEYDRDFKRCASTKVSTVFEHDVRDELDARANGTRTEADIARISADIKAAESVADAERAAKTAARRDAENRKSVVVSDESRRARGWWTNSDVASDIVRQSIKTQIDACPSEKYSIRILRRDSDEKPETRIFTREQMLSPKIVNWLRYQNTTKEILIRPLDKRYFMLDDVSTAAVDCLKDKGFSPCAVIQTSRGNNQAWYKLDSKRFDALDLQMLIEFIIAMIMRLFGVYLEVSGHSVDRAAMTSQRYGKLAGFTNRKPSREYLDGNRVLAPFVKVIEARDTAISGEQADVLLQYATGEWEKRHDKDEDKKEQRAVSALTNMQPKEPLPHFFERKMKENTKIDKSAKDASVVTLALRAGYHPKDIEVLLEQSRQDKKDPAYYAKHTVDKCVDFILFKKEEHDKQRAQEQYDAMQQ